MANTPTYRVLLDTDLGLGTPRAEIDDGAALMALVAAPQVELLAVTTVSGNVDALPAVHNTVRLLRALQAYDIPLGLGPPRPLLAERAWFAEWQAGYGPTHDVPGVFPNQLPAAANLIVDMVRAYPGEVTLMPIGPLTNIALAARLAPDIIPQVRSIMMMGALDEREPEFNFRFDPEAAHIVLSSPWPIQMISLDITRQIIFRRAAFAGLPVDKPALVLLRDQADGWIDRVESMGWEEDGCALHDAVAVAALLAPDLFSWTDTALTVELKDDARRGATQVTTTGPAGAAIQVALQAQVQPVYDLIWSLLLA